MKRKYEKTSGYWVYAHVLPTKEVYIGNSKIQPCQRWQPSMYRTTALAQYITEYGWDNIEHRVLIDNLTKEQAEQWEDRIIQSLSMNGLCINERRSGGIRRDNIQAYDKQYREEHKDYYKQYYKDHQEHYKEYDKKRRSTPERKIYNRVANYNQRHPDRKIETPMEAKQKYLETGYIPSYIKNDDL